MSMVKKFLTLLSAAALAAAAGGVAYADAAGVFLKDTDAAKCLVNKYMDSVMRSYRGDEDVSFRGIVKEGCDFWYYNDYHNDLIADMSRNEGNAELASYSVDFCSVTYSDRVYTIDTTITQQIKYKDCAETFLTTCDHIFTIEQNGRYMYITNDECNGTDKLLAPVETIDLAKK